MFHIHIAFKLNDAPKYASQTFTPLHNTCNSSTKGCRYTFTLEDVIDSFLGMIKVNIMKYRLVTNQGG
jgi:hypothetical protein